MSKIAVLSKQGPCMVRHAGNPDFKVTFGDKPVLLDKEIAEFLIKDNSNFVRTDATDAEVPKSVERLYSKTALMDMNKQEQLDILASMGVKGENTPKLEKDRVALILELQKED